ncbi:minor tail protein [Streptomyces phage Gilgamesh]|uniref:Minor tail protein n=1 Tax=Streptomyces phage Gilgamesh TaxID=2599890 RepID=A0A5J6TR25_9CAUD|nr:minor tail protein [Streptomyces phage Gilgamesh]QFG13260.1 minor tail protein [Streptomyces phage Gilgamesh]
MPPREGDWNLSYSANGIHPGANFTFGTIDSGYYLLEPYEITYADNDAGDVPMPQEDGARFGQDYRGQATITFEVGVDSVDDAFTQHGRHGANLDAVSAMVQAWDGEAVRRRFATPATLRTTQGGRSRRFFGRPRKIAPAGSKLTRQGYTPVVATFVCLDSTAYDDVEQVARVNMVPPDHYGLVGPLTTPLTMTAESAGKIAGEVVVGGTKPAWPVITFYGPIVKPVCEVVGRWSAALDLTLGVGERVVIDTRPWARTVLRNGNASVAGYLTRGTPRLKDLRLPLGRQDFVLRGTDDTGTAYMTVAWRDGYAYL